MKLTEIHRRCDLRKVRFISHWRREEIRIVVAILMAMLRIVDILIVIHVSIISGRESNLIQGRVED